MRFRGKMNWFSVDQIVKIEPSFKDALLNYSDEDVKDIALALTSYMQKKGFVFFESSYMFTPRKELLKDGIHICRYEDPAVEVRYRNVRGDNRVIEIGINFWHIA